MKINVKVIPGAKRNLIKEKDGCTKIYLSAPAINGKANKSLVKFLADHYAVRKNQVRIIKGLKSRTKLVSIDSI